MSAALKVAEVVPLPADPDIVAQLEYYLDVARAGRFVAIGIAAVTVENEEHTSIAAGRQMVQLLGAIELMKVRLLRCFGE